MKIPEQLEFFENVDNSLEISHEWSTALGQLDIVLPLVVRKTLIILLTKQDIVFTENTYDEKNKTGADLQRFDGKIYNLFDYSQYSPKDKVTVKCLKYFEKIASGLIRTYINKAWDVDKDVNINVRAFGNVQSTFGRRTAPHFHHGWDGVLVHYLTAGEEFNAPDYLLGNEPYPENVLLETDYSGDLLLLDPRPCIKYPYNNKAKTIKPKVGTTVIHPGYLWHETHTHTRSGIRVAIVVNFNIENKNFDDLPTPLSRDFI